MPVLRLLRLVLTAAALTLLSAACSDDDDADDPTVQDDGGATDDAEGNSDGDRVDGGSGDGTCRLVTTDELEALFDSPFEPGERTRDDVTSGDQCTWLNSDAPPLKVVTLVHYEDDGLQAAFGQSAEVFFGLTRESQTVDAELDLGDEAFRTGSAIWVRDGEDLYYMLITGTSDGAIAGLEALAAAVVDD